MEGKRALGVKLKFAVENESGLEFQDNISSDEHFKLTELEPYLRDLFAELSEKSPQPTEGIIRIVFIEVLIISQPWLVYDPAWACW
jgi:hypothetical protein